MRLGTQRLLLGGIVLVLAIVSISALFVVGRGGAIADNNQKTALVTILTLYGPLLGLICAFSFSSRSNRRLTKNNIPLFVLALVVTTFWCATPVLIFVTSLVIESTLEKLAALSPFGDTVVLAIIGFYFGDQGRAA
ncbi:MAG TPA: hypothetical protein VNA69_19065 [Thermoanaerobaculia bacterium]|nr:hypothetical protein [Thermoanaerobaculia bacterium]